jgi:hypothetical protein
MQHGVVMANNAPGEPCGVSRRFKKPQASRAASAGVSPRILSQRAGKCMKDEKEQTEASGVSPRFKKPQASRAASALGFFPQWAREKDEG